MRLAPDDFFNLAGEARSSACDARVAPRVCVMHNRGRARRGGRARFKAHAWNACRLERVSGVRIPPSPPHSALGESFLYDGLNAVQTQGLGGAIGFNLLTGLALDENFTVNGETIMTDALGSVIGTVDSSGTLDTTFEYDPFGNTTFSGQDNGGFWQFAGRENDLSGLYYMRARYYSPTFQRFISQDPIGFGGGDANLYAYALNNPVAFRDPFGLFTFAEELNVATSSFNETKSLSGAEMTGMLYNIDQVYANRLQHNIGPGQGTATPNLPSVAPGREEANAQACMLAAEKTQFFRKQGVDPTNGGQHFNQRAEDPEQPGKDFFNQSLDRPFLGNSEITRFGPFDNSAGSDGPGSVLPPGWAVYVNTYR
jgi:RHS repeat-associated protein